MKDYIKKKTLQYKQLEDELLNQFKKMEFIILNSDSEKIGYKQALILSRESQKETEQIRSQNIETYLDQYIDFIEENLEVGLDFDENFFLNIKNPWLRLYNHFLSISMEQVYFILEEVVEEEVKEIYFSNLLHYRVIQSFFEYHQEMDYSMTDEYLETYYTMLYNFPGLEENSPLGLNLEKWLSFNKDASKEYFEYEKQELQRILVQALEDINELDIEQYIGLITDLCFVCYYITYVKLASNHYSYFELEEIVREQLSEEKVGSFIKLFLKDNYSSLKRVKKEI